MSIAQKLITIAENMPKVFEAGKSAGNGGYEQGFEDGKQAEYDAFWDKYQQKGNRTHYGYSFSGHGWNDDTFKPKYDITAKEVNSMFTYSNITDLEKALGDKKLIFLEGATGSSVFNYAKNLTIIPVLDITKMYAPGMTMWFSSCTALHTIRKIITVETANYDRTFNLCSALVNITFEGVIGNNISFSGCPLLSDESINNIIGCLKDLTGQTAKSVDFHSTVLANLTDEQLTQISNKNWSAV